MLDFLMISTRVAKRGTIEIYPKFIIKDSKDLMIQGGDFYAIFDESKGLWSKNEQDAITLIDAELDKYAKKHCEQFDSYRVLHMWDSESGAIDLWHKYCRQQMWDNFHMLDDKLIFSNTDVQIDDYASKRLPYPLEKGDYSSWDKLLSTLYSKKERHKIEWSIGSIVNGDSKRIQKFVVFYGSAGTGKSTIMNIIQKLFEGYYSTFDAKALGSSNSSFALEPFKHNPLVAIQHDGDLSRIEDNTRLNSLVSHEEMTVNEKFKSAYSNRFRCFLYMGTNRPVKITDAKSGLLRRLIDVTPSGEKLSPEDYFQIMKRIDFELGAIAYHCREVYEENPRAYDDYVPTAMMGASNDFYNFVLDSYSVFKREDSTTLKIAWEMYNTYCEDSKIAYPLTKRIFKEELKNYFNDYKERFSDSEGRVRNYYGGFKADRFEKDLTEIRSISKLELDEIEFKECESIFDNEYASCPAQYASKSETPSMKWDSVKTVLSDLDTKKLHYVKVPENHIVIDFDIPDEKGNKSYELNLKEASKWPETYAELSKSGQGIHLHYIYSGDVEQLSRVYSEHVEVKVFTGKSSLRRKLTKCNNKPIATIGSGLPLKGDKKMINFEGVKNEKAIRTLIKRNLNKEIHPATKPSIDFIYEILDEAYKNGTNYDVSDMYTPILAFAGNSSHQSDYCIKKVTQMKFKSEEPSESVETNEDIVFYDVEVFPNLFIVNWKRIGDKNKVVRMINPTSQAIEGILNFKLVGFNCRRYDNHILYARLMGYTNEQLFRLSQKIIEGDRNAFFGEAYNISYTDIYDFASAGNKKSLKKLEIEMGIHHQELGLPWDKPVPEDKWIQVAEYCDNDVIATEAAFHYLEADFTAREILADLAGGTVNDTTNSLTTKIIFGNNRKPQDEFNYRNLAEPIFEMDKASIDFLKEACPDMMSVRHGEAKSLLPYFPGYKYEFGKSTYRDQEIGEGGRVYAEPGIYFDVALLDIASQHPHSTIAECLFGPKFTRAYRDIVEGRVSIKHEAWHEVDTMLDGKLKPYIERVKSGEMTSKSLANALKTAINSVYGLTAAKFDNAFKDKRNVDNIVAKRGALFMTDLKYEVEKRGFTVAHIKTDSIKIPNATPKIIDFVMEFGKKYGYTFEHEATYDRMCLVNDAVYIAKYATKERCEKLYGYAPGDNSKSGGKWTATGKQFQIPYIFKKLFSKEPITFEDRCETMSVTSALYLDMNEDLPDVSKEEIEHDKLMKLIADRNRLQEDMSKECERVEELTSIIEKGHNRQFIGRVGQFTPIKPGCGGGILLREAKNKKTGEIKYSAATGSKGYRWMESEMVKSLGKEKDIDENYYIAMVNDAIAEISKYGDFEQFVSDDGERETLPWEDGIPFNK